MANLDAVSALNFDVTTFADWFTAYVGGNQSAMVIAEKRFTPNLDAAFWGVADDRPCHQSGRERRSGSTRWSPYSRVPCRRSAAGTGGRPWTLPADTPFRVRRSDCGCQARGDR